MHWNALQYPQDLLGIAKNAGAANRTRTCDPVITKREFAKSVEFTLVRSSTLKCASGRVLADPKPILRIELDRIAVNSVELDRTAETATEM